MTNGDLYKGTCEWQYDNLNRLLYEKNYETDPPATIWRENTYTYDILGNRQTWTNINRDETPKTTSYSYSYNNLDQLTQETIDRNIIHACKITGLLYHIAEVFGFHRSPKLPG